MYPPLTEKIEEYTDPASQTIPQNREFGSKENSINHTCPAMQILVTPTPKLNAKSKFTKECLTKMYYTFVIWMCFLTGCDKTHYF